MITLVQPLPSSVCTIAVVFLVVSVSAPIGGSKDGGGPVATWKTGEWEECQIAQGACNTYTSIPVYGHKKRSVWCSNSGGSLIDDRFCEADRRPLRVSAKPQNFWKKVKCGDPKFFRRIICIAAKIRWFIHIWMFHTSHF